MSPEVFQVMSIAFVAWGILIALKAINCLRSGKPYVFSMWDGGMLRAGKQLNRLGMQIKVVVGIAMSASCVALLGHLAPLQTVSYVIIFIAILSIVSDLVTGSTPSA